jgi:hypothetical protein
MLIKKSNQVISSILSNVKYVWNEARFKIGGSLFNSSVAYITNVDVLIASDRLFTKEAFDSITNKCHLKGIKTPLFFFPNPEAAEKSTHFLTEDEISEPLFEGIPEYGIIAFQKYGDGYIFYNFMVHKSTPLKKDGNQMFLKRRMKVGGDLRKKYYYWVVAAFLKSTGRYDEQSELEKKYGKITVAHACGDFLRVLRRSKKIMHLYETLGREIMDGLMKDFDVKMEKKPILFQTLLNHIQDISNEEILKVPEYKKIIDSHNKFYQIE